MGVPAGGLAILFAESGAGTAGTIFPVLPPLDAAFGRNRSMTCFGFAAAVGILLAAGAAAGEKETDPGLASTRLIGLGVCERILPSQYELIAVNMIIRNAAHFHDRLFPGVTPDAAKSFWRAAGQPSVFRSIGDGMGGGSTCFSGSLLLSAFSANPHRPQKR